MGVNIAAKNDPVADNIAAVEKLRAKHTPVVNNAILTTLQPALGQHPTAIPSIVRGLKDALVSTLSNQLQSIGSKFADTTSSTLSTHAATSNFSITDPSYKAGVSAFISTYSDNEMPDYVDLINDSVDASMAEITNNVYPNLDEIVDATMKAAALMIAGTVVVMASGLGALAGANAFSDVTDTQVVKTWQALQDNHTRESHSEADGQTRSPEEPFDVGADQLLFPLDTSLGAGPDETMNCRCVVGFDVSSQTRASRRLDWAERLTSTVRSNIHLVR